MSGRIVVDDAANIAFVMTPEALIVPDTARHSSQFSISNKGHILLPTNITITSTTTTNTTASRYSYS